jgi:hypothetical protein
VTRIKQFRRLIRERAERHIAEWDRMRSSPGFEGGT